MTILLSPMSLLEGLLDLLLSAVPVAISSKHGYFVGLSLKRPASSWPLGLRCCLLLCPGALWLSLKL